MSKKDDIIGLLKKGLTTGDIIKRTGASTPYICALRAIHRPKQYKKRDILLLLERGMTPRYIADKMNVSTWYVYNLSSESGFKTAKKGFNWKLNTILKVMPLNEPISLSDVSSRIGGNDYSRNTSDWYISNRLVPLFRALRMKNKIIKGNRIKRRGNANYWIKTSEDSV